MIQKHRAAGLIPPRLCSAASVNPTPANWALIWCPGVIKLHKQVIRGRRVNYRTLIPVVIGGLAAALPQAHADTRDDVIAAIQRCGVMNDNRVWLDCVYGAIQPMRGQLGLQPAPEFQQRLVPPPQAAYAAPPPPAQPRAAARPVSRKKPGFWDNLVNAPPVSVSKMKSYHYEKNGAFVVALENGEEWRQTNIVGGSVAWNRNPRFYTVTVTQGAFGSYSLRTSDSPNTYKVEPVK
jgi:hypothetical protein